MAQVITVNQNKGSRGTGILVVRSDATGFVGLNAGADGVSRANTAGELVSTMRVAEVTWSGVAGATWAISRGNGVGANTLITLHGTNGHLDFQASQMRLEQSDAVAAANLVFTLAGGAGDIVIKLHKNSGE